MLKGIRKLFLLTVLTVMQGVLQADLPAQLHSLQGRLGGLKAKLGELRTALQSLKVQLEEAGKEEAMNQLVQEKAFDSFMKKISPHLSDKVFIDKIKAAFKKNGYAVFDQIAKLFPEDQLNDELRQVKEHFLDLYESFIEDDLKNDKIGDRFGAARAKSSRLSELERRYNLAFLKGEKALIINEIINNSSRLGIEELKTVLGAINNDYEKHLFVSLVTKALTEKFLTEADQKILAQQLIKSISLGSNAQQISTIKNIISKDGLKGFYQRRARMLLMDGLSGAASKYHNKSEMKYQGINIMPAAASKAIFPHNTGGFNDLLKKLEEGLAQKKPLGETEQARIIRVKENEKIFKAIPIAGIPCEQLYEAFAQEVEHLNFLKFFLTNQNLLKPDENKRLLAKNILQKIVGEVSSKSDDDWDTEEDRVFKIPDWFNTLSIDEALKKEALITIMRSTLEEGIKTDDEFKIFKAKCDKLTALAQPIQDILFDEDTKTKLEGFLNYSNTPPVRVHGLEQKIKNAEDAYNKAQDEEAKKRGPGGAGASNELKKAVIEKRSAFEDSDDDEEDDGFWDS